MNSDNITIDIQRVELGILSEFQRICEKYGYRYFAIGGTCIGAIRHRGFIPWDDDIDVAMPAEDYYRFIDIAGAELSKPYRLVSPSDSRHYHLHYIRIENSATTFIQDYVKSWPDRWGGIFMDIMPITGLPTDDRERKRYIRILSMYKGLNMLRRMPYGFSDLWSWKVLWPVFSIIKWIFPYDYFSHKIDELRKKYPFSSSEDVLFSWTRHKTEDMRDKKNVFPYLDFSKTIKVQFEEQTINVPIGYDHYLRADYGDYLELPDEEKRVTVHPTVFIDIHNSYTKYKKTGIPTII